jgi:hypothetical protein
MLRLPWIGVLPGPGSLSVVPFYLLLLVVVIDAIFITAKSISIFYIFYELIICFGSRLFRFDTQNVKN